MKLLLTRDQQSVLWHITETIVTPNGDRYYHSPWYMKECGDGLYERVLFENLPESAKEIILANKGIKIPTE